MNVITARPDGMTYAKYKEERTLSNKRIKEHLTGTVYYRSWYRYIDDKKVEMIARLRPFVGSAKYDLKKPV